MGEGIGNGNSRGLEIASNVAGKLDMLLQLQEQQEDERARGRLAHEERHTRERAELFDPEKGAIILLHREIAGLRWRLVLHQAALGLLGFLALVNIVGWKAALDIAKGLIGL